MPGTRHRTDVNPNESLDSLLQQLDGRFRRTTRKYGVPEDDAEDLIQQTLLAFLHKREHIHSPEVWLLGALRKECLLYLRTRRRQLYEAVDGALLELLAQPRPPGQEQSDISHDLHKALAKLPPRCASVLELRYRFGFEPAEVAEKMGYRSSSIRKVTNRCLAALSKQIVAPGSRLHNV